MCHFAQQRERIAGASVDATSCHCGHPTRGCILVSLRTSYTAYSWGLCGYLVSSHCGHPTRGCILRASYTRLYPQRARTPEANMQWQRSVCFSVLSVGVRVFWARASFVWAAGPCFARFLSVSGISSCDAAAQWSSKEFPTVT